MNTSSQHLEFDSSAEAAPSWKQEVNQRLAAHRTRRTRKADDSCPRLPLGLEATPATARGDDAASVAARVAARYAKVPSYSEMIAAEARAAAQAADDAAKAAQKAQAAVQAVLEGLDFPHGREPEKVAELRGEALPPEAATAAMSVSAAGSNVPLAAARPEIEYAHARAEAWSTPHAHILEHTIDPMAEAMVTPSQPLPPNLIEFPRELVAARKARPRLAEGPLRDGPGMEPEKSQLRIFEVEANAISTQPDGERPVKTEWSSIRLDAHPEHGGYQPEIHQAASLSLELPLQTASVEDRVMAAVVDMALMLAAFLMFVLVFVACTTHPPTGKPAVAGAALVLVAFALLYQLLFFTYAEGTPGMRYARIALCTFDDENPTRKAMRLRIWALALSLCALGLGCAWAFFDEDRLGWHDRLTRTYQRSYR